MTLLFSLPLDELGQRLKDFATAIKTPYHGTRQKFRISEQVIARLVSKFRVSRLREWITSAIWVAYCTA